MTVVTQFDEVEQGFLRKMREGCYNTDLYDYMAWLGERRRWVERAFLQVLETTTAAFDGDWSDGEVCGEMASRAELRDLRPHLSPAWLAALGDRGLFGEILVWGYGRTGRTMAFSVILGETQDAVLMHHLERRLVEGERRGGRMIGTMCPVLPTTDDLSRMASSSSLVRAIRCPDGTFLSGAERYEFWDGEPCKVHDD